MTDLVNLMATVRTGLAGRVTIAALGVGVLAGCAGPSPVKRGPLVEAADLPPECKVVILDARSEAEFATGHLPGAVRIDAERWKSASLSPEAGLDHAATWHAIFGDAGITGRDPILIYDDGRMTEAARAWFILQHFGAADVAVINGGFPSLAQQVAAGRLQLHTQSAPPRRVAFRPHGAVAVGVIERDALRQRIERREVQVLDARSRDEYTGRDLRKNRRGGHLPTATSVPHTELLRDGRLKPPAELADLLAGAGFQRGRPVITHCDGGGRASLAALAAQQAGYGPVLNYYLSYGDWAADATCPVEGTAPAASAVAGTTTQPAAP